MAPERDGLVGEPRQLIPGPAIASDDDDALVRAAQASAGTIFHPDGSAKIGLASDPLAVVDAELRVFGVERLRVIDASIMPQITSGNTNAPTIVIGEKCADLARAASQTQGR